MYVRSCWENGQSDIILQAYCELKISEKLYTWELWKQSVWLCFWNTSKRRRGLPSDYDFKVPSVARVFSSILHTGIVMDADFATKDHISAMFSQWLVSHRQARWRQNRVLFPVIAALLIRGIEAARHLLMQLPSSESISWSSWDVISIFSPRICSRLHGE